VICLLTEKWTSQADHQRQSALPPYLKTLTLPLPVSSGFVFLRSRGSYGHGTVKFELSDQSDDEIMVDIALGYYTLTALGRGSICLLERDEGGQGVGIFVSHWASSILSLALILSLRPLKVFNLSLWT
jgi:hypothetical protein